MNASVLESEVCSLLLYLLVVFRAVGVDAVELGLVHGLPLLYREPDGHQETSAVATSHIPINLSV